MTDESVKRILTAPIVLLRPADEEERRIFPKEQKGWFYTVGLQSGQSFVAHLPKYDDIFTFRPLNNLVPQLVQFQWEKQRTFSVFPAIHTSCQTTLNTTEEDKTLLTEALSPVRDNTNAEYPWQARVYRYRYPEMFVKVSSVRKQLVENERLQLALLKGQKELQKLMVSYNNNQTTQHKLNERRQNG